MSALTDRLKGPDPGYVPVLLLAGGDCAPVYTREWIERDLRLVLHSVASGSALGWPDEETLTSLEDYQLLRTDGTGWIEVSAEGERLWVEVEEK